MAHKMGIIGYGGVAAGWHHENIKKSIEGLEVVAAYDINPDRLAAAKSRGLKAYENLDDFLSDGGFDIVLVATPNNFHKCMVISALEAGKHVVCEKPVAMNMEDFDAMHAAAKSTGKLFTVHQNRRWDRDFQIIKKTIETGLVGKPYTIESRVMGQNGVMHGWRAYKVAGGGMVFDWGVHLIDQILWMLKEPVSEVYANLHSVKTPEVDDYFKAVLRFDSGLTAQIEVGTYNLERLPRWYVCGDGGAVVVNDWECNGRITHAKDFEMAWEQEIVQTEGGPTRTMAPRPKETLEELPLPEVATDWCDYYKNIMAVLDGEAELIVKPEEVRKAMQVITAIFESSETGRAVKIDRYYK
ncbi:MAG: Gfo/Idh/MocA family oxidoreductase [Oscillospiraceae bacterium]|nr:Gfo/Idh/MocA family oxidoreductase [Oscillospiraceae bacterium]